MGSEGRDEVEKVKRALRVGLDTNVVLSALLFANGRLSPLRMAWQRRTLTPLLSKPTFEELLRVLQYPKFKLDRAEQDELLSDYVPYCTSIVMPAPPVTALSCRDTNDVPFLELATHGKADYLVSGDADLLDITDKTPFRIIAAKDFLSLIEGI